MKKITALLLVLCCLNGFSQTVDITFNVNMEYQTVSEQGVFIAGGGNFGNPGDNPLSDPEEDGIYSITVTQDVGFNSYYIFTNGACPDYSCKENLAGQPCGDPDNFNDRFLPSVTQDTVVNICFNQCTTDGSCEQPSEPADVTFSVDMEGQTVAGEMYITGGAIDNWCGNCTAMDDSDGDDIYTITLSLVPGTYEYKYNNGGWDGTETLDATEDAGCTLTTGEFTNRIIEVSSSDPLILDVNCFEGCGSCVTSVDELKRNGFSLSPNFTSDYTMITFSDVSNTPRIIRLYSLSGSLVAQERVGAAVERYELSVAGMDAGIYMVSMEVDGRETATKLVITD